MSIQEISCELAPLILKYYRNCNTQQPIFIYFCRTCMNLTDSKKSIGQQRRRIIEQAFQASTLRNYQMPRTSMQGELESIEDIPQLYNLHTQNPSNKPASLLSLDQLIAINLRSTSPSATLAKRRSSAQMGLEPSRESSRTSRIHCTVSRQRQRKQGRSAPKGSWWCCLKDEGGQQFQIRELGGKDEWLRSTILPFVQLSDKKTSKRTNSTKMDILSSSPF